MVGLPASGTECCYKTQYKKHKMEKITITFKDNTTKKSCKLTLTQKENETYTVKVFWKPIKICENDTYVITAKQYIKHLKS